MRKDNKRKRSLNLPRKTLALLILHTILFFSTLAKHVSTDVTKLFSSSIWPLTFPEWWAGWEHCWGWGKWVVHAQTGLWAPHRAIQIPRAGGCVGSRAEWAPHTSLMISWAAIQQVWHTRHMYPLSLNNVVREMSWRMEKVIIHKQGSYIQKGKWTNCKYIKKVTLTVIVTVTWQEENIYSSQWFIIHSTFIRWSIGQTFFVFFLRTLSLTVHFLPKFTLLHDL